MNALDKIAEELNLNVVYTTRQPALSGFSSYQQVTEVVNQLGDDYKIVSLTKRPRANTWRVEGPICEAYDMLEYWSDRGAECYTSSDYDLFISSMKTLEDKIDGEGMKTAECIQNLPDGSILVLKDDRTSFVTERYCTSYLDDNSVHYQIGVIQFMKYPEFREKFKNAQWFGGHLCYQDGLYYRLVRTDIGKKVISYTEDQLTDWDRTVIEREKKMEIEWAKGFVDNMLSPIASRYKLEEYAREHGRIVRKDYTNRIEYWEVQSLKDGKFYTVSLCMGFPFKTLGAFACRFEDMDDMDCRNECELLGIL